MGFLARFLFAFPRTTQGTRLFKRKPKWSAMPLYHTMIANLLDIPLQTNSDGEISPKVVTLSKEADELWIKFHNKIESNLGLGGKYECVNDVASKTPEQAVRIAAIFNASEGIIFEEISAETFQNAAIIAEWYLNEFRRYMMHSVLSEDMQFTIQLKEWLIDHCLQTNESNFEVRYIVQKGPNGLRDTQKVRMLLENLCERYNVFWEDIYKKTRFIVNPKLLRK